MPIYEYYCPECDGIFEQLQSVRRASDPQPCVVCDADARRMMPQSFHSFTVRDGVPRRIPDRGTYWHLEKEVGRPVDTTVQAFEHPDLIYDKYGPERPPTPEEREAFEERQVQRMEQMAEQISTADTIPWNDPAGDFAVDQFVKRVRKTAPAAAAQRRRNPNSQVTPRTVTGTHPPSTTAPKRTAKRRTKD